MKIKIQDILTVSYKQEEEKAIAAIKENPKFFDKYAAKHSEAKSNVGPLINEQGQKVYTNLKKLQKSIGYNMKVFSVNQIGSKRSKTLQTFSRI